jgi:hypothetical protein
VIAERRDREESAVVCLATRQFYLHGADRVRDALQRPLAACRCQRFRSLTDVADAESFRSLDSNEDSQRKLQTSLEPHRACSLVFFK